MRAREFISEASRPGRRAEANHEFDVAHPGLVGPPASGDTYWGRYYDFYRLASLAGMDIEQLESADDISFFGNLPVFSAYTEYDRRKLIAIMKKLGMKPQDHVEPGSHEPDYVNKSSPLPAFKGYKK